MKNCTVHLFVFEGMADWEAAFASACIHNPQFQSRPGRYQIRTAGRSLAPVTTMGGMRILPNMTIDEVCPANSSMLILPGGTAWESGGNLEALERALVFAHHGIPVAAICAATLALARTGLLDDRLHTSNDAAYLASCGYAGRSFYRDVPAITDGDIITAAGIAPLEFAREIARTLDLYSSDTLAAWYALYKHGNASKFYEMAAQPA